jgi:hypothetical protein
MHMRNRRRLKGTRLAPLVVLQQKVKQLGAKMQPCICAHAREHGTPKRVAAGRCNSAASA